MAYIDGLSDMAKCYVYEYTKDSIHFSIDLAGAYGISTTENYQIGLLTGQMWEKIGLLISILYNAPLRSDLELYSFYKEGYNDFSLSLPEPILTPIKREMEMAGNISTVPVIFTSTTTEKDVFQYFSSFHDETCCHRIIRIEYPFPILKVNELSSYPYQNEVILPPFIILKSNSKSTNTVIEEYSIEELQKCSQLIKGGQSYCGPSIPYETRILNHECLSKYKHRPANLDTAGITISTIPMERSIVMYINTILNDYYFLFERENPDVVNPRPPCLHHHGIIHICNTIAISMVLFLSLVQKENTGSRDDVINELRITILSSLFHDTGRKGRAGPDQWEAESADIAKKHLLEVIERPDIIDIISLNISTKVDVDRFSYYAYKGADSIEINRLRSYDQIYNPFYKKYGHYNVLANSKTESSLVGSEKPGILVSEFESFTSIINIILSDEHLERAYKKLINVGLNWESTVVADFYTGNVLRDAFIVQNETVELKNNQRALFRTCLVYPTEKIKKYDNEEEKNKNVRQAVRNLALKLNDFFLGILSLIRLFHEKMYLKDNTRYFDDYWEILLAFLNFMPYTANELCKIIVPYEHRLLYRPRR
jgi:hypothetical protein